MFDENQPHLLTELIMASRILRGCVSACRSMARRVPVKDLDQLIATKLEINAALAAVGRAEEKARKLYSKDVLDSS